MRNTRAKPKPAIFEFFCFQFLEAPAPASMLCRNSCDVIQPLPRIALPDTRRMRHTAFALAARTACFAVLGAAATLAAAAALGRAARAEDRIATQPETASAANHEIQAQLEALRQALATHAAEASRLDHAFRTPIGAAAAALQLLETSAEDPELQAQARQVIARQLSRMTALTESLRETAQRLSSQA